MESLAEHGYGPEYVSDLKRSWREGMKKGPPRWLHKPSIRQELFRQFLRLSR